jgi:spoIIIJ-associated protein
VSPETEPLELEIAGETVGEAKWLALRELERMHPGLDRDLVRFEVLSEGERGLLGVGTSPARVVARLDSPPPAPPVEAPPEPATPSESYSPAAELVCEVVERITAAIGADCRIDVREEDETVFATVSGRGVGLLIGRGGRTIDAVQYLVSAAAHRRWGESAKTVEIDAASYRQRRRVRLAALARRSAERAVARGEPVALEPMTPVERKLVHVTLQDVPGVETRSEGEEPSRYVVIAPTSP